MIEFQFNFQCGLSENSLQSRLHGGTEAKVGQFPFHTAVYRDSVYRCGGSLISEGTVLTACHCVVDDLQAVFPASEFNLLFGSVDLKSLSGNEALREVSEIIKHPDYDFDKILKQDIALMRIKGNLQLSPSIRPICLFPSHTPISNAIDQQATVLGFGSNENSREPSQYLNHGKMSIISRQQCIESKLIFGLLPEQSAFCAKAVNNMIACPGDSGGEWNMVH
jgi:secreted trypsin-like serine protease